MACRRHSIANQRLRPRARHRLSAGLVAASVCALPLLAAPAAKGAVTLSVPSDTTFEVGTSFLLPVRTTALQPGDDVRAFKVALLMNTKVVEIGPTLVAGALLVGKAAAQLTFSRDSIKVQWSDTTPVIGEGVLFSFDCRIRDRVRDRKRVTLKLAPFVRPVKPCDTCPVIQQPVPVLNGGVPAAEVRSGWLTVTNSTGTLPQNVVLSVPSDTAFEPGSTYRMPVRISEVVESDDVIGFNFGVVFPRSVLKLDSSKITTHNDQGHIWHSYEGVVVSPMLNGWMFLNSLVGDTIKLVGSRASPLVGSGTMFTITFFVRDDAPELAIRDVEIVRMAGAAYVNEYNSGPPSVAQNGLVRVSRWVAVRDERPRPHLPPISAWPNPFNPRVNLRLNSPYAEAFAGGAIKGMIVNPLGQVVRRWAMPGGGHEALWTWDGLDDAGRPVSSGVYLVVLGGRQQWYRSTITLLR